MENMTLLKKNFFPGELASILGLGNPSELSSNIYGTTFDDEEEEEEEEKD
jgi:hypothetical protein